MNDFLSKNRLKQLIQTNQEPCVSIYMPTHRMGDQTQQDPIRLRNLLNEAQTKLEDGGMRRPDAAKMLQPASQLLDDYHYWQNQSDGLVLLLNMDEAHIHRLPLQFEEMVDISDQFHVKPILPLFNSDGRFYILALSQNEIRLLEASKHHVDEVTLRDIPTSMAEALWFDDKESQLQHHTSAEAGRQFSGREAIFHGHGVGDDDHKDDILRFFRRIDSGINEILGNETSPMVLVGVDYLQPIYQQASNYPHLVTRGVDGNPEILSSEELHAQAWQIVKPIFQHDCEKAKDRYHAGLAHDTASKDIRTIVPAAIEGRIDVAFTTVGEQRWGRFDITNYSITLEDQATDENQDLLNFIAAQTLLHDGEVYALPREDMPDHVLAAAVFRY